MKSNAFFHTGMFCCISLSWNDLGFCNKFVCTKKINLDEIQNIILLNIVNNKSTLHKNFSHTTRKHSSRVHTTHLLTVSHSISEGGLPNPPRCRPLDADPLGCRSPGGRSNKGRTPLRQTPRCRSSWRQTIPEADPLEADLLIMWRDACWEANPNIWTNTWETSFGVR